MKKIFLSVVFSFIFPLSAYCGSINAQVDNTQVPYGELFELKIIYDGDDGNTLTPDLRDLQKDFIIYSTSSSMQSTYINGKGTQIRSWNVGLMPQQKGKLTIPAIPVGKYKTQPIDIEVVAAGSDIKVSASNGNKNNTAQIANFNIEFQVKDKNPYVQQQVNAELIIDDNRGLHLESMPVFADSDDWVIKSMSQPIVEDKNGGRKIKFKYALFPQKSGNLQIPSATVNAYYVSYDSQNAATSFGGGFFRIFDMDINGLFGVNKPVRLVTKPQNIMVKPALKEAGDWWLPATSLGVSAKWTDKKPEFKVGETVAREITIAALGVADTQLPELTFTENPMWKQYPEKPQYSSVVDGGEILSQSVTRIVYIPQKMGEIELPEIVIPWYNVATNTLEKAIVPAEKINVKGNPLTVIPEAGAQYRQTPQQAETSRKYDEAVNRSISELESNIKNGLLIFAAFICGLLFSYFLFGYKRKQADKPTLSGYLSAVEKCLSDKDYRGVRDNLLRFADEIFPGRKINNLNDLAVAVGQAEFSEQMDLINRILYADSQIEPNSKIIMQTLKRIGKKAPRDEVKQPLPNLYR